MGRRCTERSFAVEGFDMQISCQNLAVGYEGKEVVQGINFSVRHGDNLKQNYIGYLPQQTAIQKDFPNRKEIVRMNTPKMRQR